MAKAIAEGIAEEKIPVKLFNLKRSDWSEIVKEILTAKVILFGTSTLNNTMLPTLGGFLTYLSGLRPKGKIVGCFGSFGWGGGGTRAVENQLKSMGLELIGPSLEALYVPDKENLGKCLELGKAVASKITEGTR
jgi:flavorubredoxin